MRFTKDQWEPRMGVALPMSQPTRLEIEKYARDKFSASCARIASDYLDKNTQLLNQVRLTQNGGGYLLEVTNLAAERVRETVLAYGDAYAEAFGVFKVFPDHEAEQSLCANARQLSAGCISQVLGHLASIDKTTRQLIMDPGTNLNHEIEKSMRLALAEARRRLRQPRIQSAIYVEH